MCIEAEQIAVLSAWCTTMHEARRYSRGTNFKVSISLENWSASGSSKERPISAGVLRELPVRGVKVELEVLALAQGSSDSAGESLFDLVDVRTRSVKNLSFEAEPEPGNSTSETLAISLEDREGVGNEQKLSEGGEGPSAVSGANLLGLSIAGGDGGRDFAASEDEPVDRSTVSFLISFALHATGGVGNAARSKALMDGVGSAKFSHRPAGTVRD